MGMIEREGEVRTKVIESRDGETLKGEIRDNVESGTEVMTDAFVGYQGLSADYIHQVVNHAIEYVRGRVHTNKMENFWSLVKRALGGTYISVMPFHLFRYLDEQTFRYNYRKRNDRERFLIVCASMDGKRLSYKKLTGKTLMRAEAF